MADGIIEKLIISIGVDSKGVEQGATNAVKKASSALKSAIGTFIAPVMGALLSGQFIKNTYQEIINLDHLSTSLGVNVERLQMWQGAAKDAGSSAEAVGALWQRMNAMITEASVNGSGRLHDLAEKGIVPALKTVDGKVKDTDTYLLELSDTLHKMDAQAASGFGRQLGIRDYNLMNFLQQGSGAINQQLKHIKDLGVYTQRDVEIAREFDVALNDVTRVMKMSLVPIFRLVTPLISKLGMALVQLRQHWMVFGPVIALIAGMIMKTLIPSFKALWVDGLKPLLMNPAMWKLAAIAAALVLLGLALEDIYVWINGGQSVVGRYLGSWEEFKPKIQPAIDVFNALVTQCKEVWRAMGELVDIIRDLPENASVAFGQTKDAIYREFVQPVTEWFNELLSTIQNFFNFVGNIGNSIKSIGTNAKNLLSRGSVGNTDNSQHSTSVVQNNTFNGVKDGQDGANRLMGNNPVPAYNGSYK